MAVGLARLGLDVGMIACVGDDPLGDFLIEYLESQGVSTSNVGRKTGVQSSLCLSEVSPPDRFPQVFYRARAADTQLEIGPDELAAIETSRFFVTNGTSLCESPSRESTFLALERARRSGVKVALDVDYREMSWRSGDEAGLYSRLALPCVDVLLVNEQELELVGRSADPATSVRSILELGVSLVVAKLGERGALAATPDESFFLPSFKTPMLSTIGAGDGFAAGFLYALVEGIDLAEALRYGNAVAAIVVGRLMCAEAMPRLDELEEMLRAQPKNQAREPERALRP